MAEKLTGDPKIDFPELYSNEVDNSDELAKYDAFLIQTQMQSEYVKKNIIEEVIENVEVKEDNTLYDKRLKKTLIERIYNALFS